MREHQSLHVSLPDSWKWKLRASVVDPEQNSKKDDVGDRWYEERTIVEPRDHASRLCDGDQRLVFCDTLVTTSVPLSSSAEIQDHASAGGFHEPCCRETRALLARQGRAPHA